MVLEPRSTILYIFAPNWTGHAKAVFLKPYNEGKKIEGKWKEVKENVFSKLFHERRERKWKENNDISFLPKYPTFHFKGYICKITSFLSFSLVQEH